MKIRRRIGLALACALILAFPLSAAARVFDDLRESARTSVPRLRFSGQTDVRFADAGPGLTPFTFNDQGDTGGISTFCALDLHLFITAALSPRTKVFVKLLGSADDASRMEVEAFALTTKLGEGWPVLDVGRFTSNFGRFAQRFLPMDNPLVGEPLLYTYRTNLPTSQVTASGDDLVAQRGLGNGRVQLAGYGDASEGLELVSSSWFYNGLKLSGHRKKLRYSLAVTNEPASGSNFFDANDNKAVTVHVAYKPMLALGIGLSASRGAYLDRGVFEAPQATGLRLGDFPESSLGVDVDYALGRFVFFSECVYKNWDSPTIPGGLKAYGFFVEPRYKVLPGLYVALRAEHLQFDAIPVAGGRAPSDFDVSRLELGAGYTLERDLRVKASYQWNYTGGASPSDPDDDLVQAQLVSAF